jgi:putative ABC transport system substrate-binding protein
MERTLCRLTARFRAPGSITDREGADVSDAVGATFIASRAAMAAAAAHHRLPLICGAREMAEAGCLFSYSASIKDMWYRSASFVDKILKGAKPADLPVQQGTKFELVFNLKTAKALGLEIPSQLLALADEVIE